MTALQALAVDTAVVIALVELDRLAREAARSKTVEQGRHFERPALSRLMDWDAPPAALTALEQPRQQEKPAMAPDLVADHCTYEAPHAGRR
jgi:hypothetical protein